MVYQVQGRLDKRFIPQYLEVIINGSPVIAEVRYSRNALRLRIANHLESGQYNVAINPSVLIDVFGRPAALADARVRSFKL